MATDPILDLIIQQDREIDNVQQLLSGLAAQASEARATLSELIVQREALEQIAIRRGWDVPPAPGEVRSLDSEDWINMPRTRAVEKVLEESSTGLHLTEIQTNLKMHGRTDDSLEVISASLAHLKKSRGSVVSLGAGRWEFIRAGTNTGRHPVMDQMAAEVQSAVGRGRSIARLAHDSDSPEKPPQQGWKEGDETHQPY